MFAITEGSEYTGESGKTYLTVSPLGQANVWTAVEKHSPSNIVIIKGPSPDDDPSSAWPRFQHEMIMHELFKSNPWIRRQIDRIPADSVDHTRPPLLVLEILETTLWQARTKRPFGRRETRVVANAVLHALAAVHAQGLVYADLKMQNVLLSGFDVHTGEDNNKEGEGLRVALGDLGIVMAPAKGRVQPVAYRAPEVYFRGTITAAADIWGFGLLYCHLLEAQTHFTRTGLYDGLVLEESDGQGSIPEREHAMRVAMAHDFDLWHDAYYEGCDTLPYPDPKRKAGRHWAELKQNGIDDEDMELLQWILQPDPMKRPSAKQILASKWFHGSEGKPLSRTFDGAAEDESTPPMTKKPRQEAVESTRRDSAELRSPVEVKATEIKGTNQSPRGPYLPWLHKQDASSPAVSTWMTPAMAPVVHSAPAPAPTEDSVTQSSAPEPAATLSSPGVSTSAAARPSNGCSPAEAADPSRPAHVGAGAATGGTYLSYR